VNQLIAKDLQVFQKEAPLDEARKIRGLRAVFGEVRAFLRYIRICLSLHPACSLSVRTVNSIYCECILTLPQAYANPVRVVSVGARVEDLLAQPDTEEWLQYPIEFCGGMHLSSIGPIKNFCIVAQEALGAGTPSSASSITPNMIGVFSFFFFCLSVW
jgi:alanyl-tRNA synthetase